MNRAHIPPLVIVLALMGGCSMAPDYSRPEAPIPADWPKGGAYVDGQSAVSPAVDVPALGWKEFITDESLRQVIETALANNRDLRLAALNVELARAQYGIQRTELYPALYGSAVGSRQRTSADLTSPGVPRTTKQYQVDVGVLSWEIDFFGRLRGLKDQALETYLGTEQAHRSAQILLVSSVADAYMSLAADREALVLAERTLETQTAYYELVKRRYDLDVATELDLHRAQVPVEVARADVARYSRQAAQAENALRLLVGSDVSEELLPGELGGIRPPRQVSAGLSSDVILGRPDVISAEHQIRAVHGFIGAARAAFFPRISLTSTIGTASDEVSSLFSNGTNTWSFAPQVSMPIFDARTWSAYRASKVQREIAVTTYEKTVQAAFREVADALALRGTIDKQVAAQTALVAALAKTHELASSRFEEGIDSYLGVLDAQRSLFDAQQGLVSLRLAQLTSQTMLYATLGGGALAFESEEALP